MTRDSFSYAHGDTGTAPPSALNFQSGESPDSEHFDWFWDQVINAINGHADEFDRLDNDDDGIVDEADYANDADASTYKGNDIDTNGNGVVDQAADSNTLGGDSKGTIKDDSRTQSNTLRIEVRSSAPSSPTEGDIWLRTDL